MPSIEKRPDSEAARPSYLANFLALAGGLSHPLLSFAQWALNLVKCCRYVRRLPVDRQPTSFTVADYCAAMRRGEIVVNQNYQRSDQVWPQVARSYLIETILKGFPVPKLYLYQVTDVRSRKTLKEIVDGQQRSAAIYDFYNDEFKLPKSAENEDVRGKKYSELDDEYKHKFLDYPIGVDLFVNTTPSEVVEVFRRMNSYTAPLNPEEHRHASWQGKFKWFINGLADRLEAIFLATGVFKEKQLVRMADNKLLTELCDSFLYGIRTTNKKTLDDLYESRDDEFPEQDDLLERILSAFKAFREMEPVHNTALAKPHMAYSLIQAIAHMTKPFPKLERLFASPRIKMLNLNAALPRLTALAEAVENGEETGKFAKFVDASTEKTNVKANRETRFKAFCRALTD
jgi:hypothetical protein